MYFTTQCRELRVSIWFTGNERCNINEELNDGGLLEDEPVAKVDSIEGHWVGKIRMWRFVTRINDEEIIL